MPLEPIPIETGERDVPIAVVADATKGFEVRLDVFEGPLQLLLHLIESRQLDILTVPLADLADAYVNHLAEHPVEPGNLSEFVAIAAQLILLKSRRLLPGEQVAADAAGDEEPDEEDLRRRIIAYRAIREAAARLAALDMAAPLMRREPRETDLPEAPVPPAQVALLVEALARLAAVAEPPEPAPQVMAREITIGMQILALRQALAEGGRLVLQAIIAQCRSRTEAAVTVLAALELVRRREVRVRQSTVFGPIVMEPMPAGGAK